MVAVVGGGVSLLELRVRAKLCCKESVNFGFEELNSSSQNVRFGGKVTQLRVFEGELLLAHCECTLGQLKVQTALGQSRP